MPEPTTDERARAADAAEAQATMRSLYQSRARIRSVLSIPCAQCGAAKGAFCVPSARGFCRMRWDKGADLLSFPGALEPGDLGPAAQVVRNVALHRTQKMNDAERRYRMARLSGGRR